MTNENISYMLMPALKKKYLLNGSRGQTDLIERIIEKTCEFYDQLREDVESKKRYRPMVICRQMCVYMLRKHTHIDYKTIGNLMGGRDHTTCLHSIKTINDLIYSDEKFIRDINSLEALIF